MASNSKTLTGSAFALARWFGGEQYANGPQDDFTRERLLSSLYDGTHVACSGDTVLVKTPLGACMIEVERHGAGKLVHFDFVNDTTWERIRFWMNASSVEDLGAHLRTLPRADFDALFVGAVI